MHEKKKISDWRQNKTAADLYKIWTQGGSCIHAIILDWWQSDRIKIVSCEFFFTFAKRMLKLVLFSILAGSRYLKKRVAKVWEVDCCCWRLIV
jgi:hypothetical protein